MISLAEIVRRRRTELGIEQTELDRRVGRRPGWVASVETGRIRRPQADALAKLAKELGLPPEVVFEAAGVPYEGVPRAENPAEAAAEAMGRIMRELSFVIAHHFIPAGRYLEAVPLHLIPEGTYPRAFIVGDDWLTDPCVRTGDIIIAVETVPQDGDWAVGRTGTVWAAGPYKAGLIETAKGRKLPAESPLKIVKLARVLG